MGAAWDDALDSLTNAGKGSILPPGARMEPHQVKPCGVREQRMREGRCSGQPDTADSRREPSADVLRGRHYGRASADIEKHNPLHTEDIVDGEGGLGRRPAILRAGPHFPLPSWKAAIGDVCVVEARFLTVRGENDDADRMSVDALQAGEPRRWALFDLTAAVWKPNLTVRLRCKNGLGRPPSLLAPRVARRILALQTDELPYQLCHWSRPPSQTRANGWSCPS